MNLRNTTASACLATVVLVSFSASAHAVTVTLSNPTTRPPTTPNGLSSTRTGATTIDFNSLSNTATPSTNTYTSGIATYSTNPTPTTGNGIFVRNSTQTSGSYAPQSDTTNFLITGGYYNQANTAFTAADRIVNPININFSTPIKYFGMYWGLINPTNTVELYNGSNLLSITRGTFSGTSITGSDLGLGAEVGTGLSGPSRYVDFDAGVNESITRVRLFDTDTRTTPNGFETDNHAYAVPAPPATLGLLVLGALGAGSTLKRKLRGNPKLISQFFSK